MAYTKTEKVQLKSTEEYVRKEFESDGSGHDWWHILRVKNTALRIAESEGGNLFIIEMAALLHDLDDWKLNKPGRNKTKSWLEKVGISKIQHEEIVLIIEQVSFKGAGVNISAGSLEAQIVQDADRLDAIGAIGIARTFAYGGSKGRLIYHPDIEHVLHSNFEEYKNSSAPTINHFYEKLLLLKNRLNTKTAIEIAENRHTFMKEFLHRFFAEWKGEM